MAQQFIYWLLYKKRYTSMESPYLFARYIRDLINTVVDSGVGCKVADQTFNILAYANDLVLLAPSWKALQTLISILHLQATHIDMSTINIQKTVAMVFAPKRRGMIVSSTYPPLKIGNQSLHQLCTTVQISWSHYL